MSANDPRPDDLRDQLASLRIDRQPEPTSGSRWPIVLVLLLLGGGAAVWAMNRKAAPMTVQTVMATAAAPGAPRAGTSVLTASGYLVARRKAVVSAKIQGRLAELRVEEGSRVTQGQLLARLESNDLQAQVARARAGVQRAEADAAEAARQLEVSRRLTAEMIVSTDQTAMAASRVRVAQAQVAEARADLGFAESGMQNTRILSPFSGTVVKKMAEVGESVAPIPPGVNLSTSSGAIVAIADLETLEVEADVSESNVSKLLAEQPAEVTVEAVPDRTYKAVLRQVIPTADRTKATVQVKVTMLEKDDRLRPEMSAKVTFLQPESTAPVTPEAAAKVFTVPADAVVTRGGRSVVFEIVDGVARSRAVETSRSRDGRVEIRSGLNGGELLVAKPIEALQDGTRVNAAS